MIAKVVGIVMWALIGPWLGIMLILVFTPSDEGMGYWIGAGFAVVLWLVFLGTVLWALGNIQQSLGTAAGARPPAP